MSVVRLIGVRACLVLVLASLCFSSLASPAAAQPALADVQLRLLPDDPSVDVSSVDVSWMLTDEDDQEISGGGTFDLTSETVFLGQLQTNTTYWLVLNAGPAFEPITEFSFTTTDVTIQSFNVDLTAIPAPPAAASVTVYVSSADPAVADALPDGSTWTVSQGGVPLFSDTFAPEHLALPASISVTNPVPFGSYDVTIDAGPAFESYTGTFAIETAEAALDIVLTPVEEESPIVPRQMFQVMVPDGLKIPRGAAITLLGQGGTLNSSVSTFGTFGWNNVWRGDWTLTIDLAGFPEFAAYSQVVTVTGEQITVALEAAPAEPETSAVSITLSSSNPTVASAMLEGSTWAVTLLDGTVVDSGTFAAEHLALPVTIPVNDTVPYGEYLVSINALPIFGDYQHVHEINAPEQVVDVVLDPITTSEVTLSLVSADPDLASQLPDGASWTLSTTDGTVVDSGEFVDALDLPTAFRGNGAVPYGEYLVSINGLPIFEAYQHTHVIDQPRQTVEIVLTPAPDGALVSLNLSSADPDAASVMPAGSTYTIASVDNPNFTLVEEFTGEGLNLPASVLLDQPLPYGDYVVTIDATPAFETFVGEFTVAVDPLAMAKRGFFAQAASAVPFDIVLVPARINAPLVSVDLSMKDGATVAALPLTYGVWGEAGQVFNSSATVDVPGTIEIGNLAAGDYSVSVNADGYYPAFVLFTVEAADEGVMVPVVLEALPAEAAIVLDLSLEDGGSITGLPISYGIFDAGYGLVLDGGGSVNVPTTLEIGALPVGEYVMVLEAPGYDRSVVAIRVDEYSREIVVPVALVPATSAIDAGSLVVSVFACSHIAEPTANVSEPVSTDLSLAAQGVELVEGCAPASASFAIYLNGDRGAEPYVTFVADSTAAANGLPTTPEGTSHLLVDRGTGAAYPFTVASDAVTTATILNPSDDGGTSSPAATPTPTATVVTRLPSTGQGAAPVDGANVALFLAGAGLLMASAAGFWLRSRRA
ncbi:MAG TPA: hypothetical protein VM450_17175 [Thermomicrobiales bacterium]|nr:hypothetical protein [Thermomicrobiales bacterium]